MLVMSATSLLPSIFIFKFRQAIRHRQSSAGDDESDSKFEYIRNKRVARDHPSSCLLLA